MNFRGVEQNLLFVMRSILNLFLLCVLFSCNLKVEVGEIISSDSGDIFVLTKNVQEKNQTYRQIGIIEKGTPIFLRLKEELSGLKFYSDKDFSDVFVADYTLMGRTFHLYINKERVKLRIGNKEYYSRGNLESVLPRLTKHDHHKFENLYGVGKVVHDSWTWCSTVPIEQHYQYKQGHWKFWSDDYKYLGEGKIVVEIDTLDLLNSCGDLIFMRRSKVDIATWQWSIDEELRPAVIDMIENVRLEDSMKIEIPTVMD